MEVSSSASYLGRYISDETICGVHYVWDFMALGFSLGTLGRERTLTLPWIEQKKGKKLLEDSGNIRYDIKVALIVISYGGDAVFNLALLTDCYWIYVYFLVYLVIYFVTVYKFT
jgi:hypothetical protein